MRLAQLPRCHASTKYAVCHGGSSPLECAFQPDHHVAGPLHTKAIGEVGSGSRVLRAGATGHQHQRVACACGCEAAQAQALRLYFHTHTHTWQWQSDVLRHLRPSPPRVSATPGASASAVRSARAQAPSPTKRLSLSPCPLPLPLPLPKSKVKVSRHSPPRCFLRLRPSSVLRHSHSPLRLRQRR